MDGALSLKFGITAGIRCFAGLIYFLLECRHLLWQHLPCEEQPGYCFVIIHCMFGL